MFRPASDLSSVPTISDPGAFRRATEPSRAQQRKISREIEAACRVIQQQRNRQRLRLEPPGVAYRPGIKILPDPQIG